MDLLNEKQGVELFRKIRTLQNYNFSGLKVHQKAFGSAILAIFFKLSFLLWCSAISNNRAMKDHGINCSDNICQLQAKYWQHVIVFPGTFKELLFSNIRLFLMSNGALERRRTLCIFYEHIKKFRGKVVIVQKDSKRN